MKALRDQITREQLEMMVENQIIKSGEGSDIGGDSYYIDEA